MVHNLGLFQELKIMAHRAHDDLADHADPNLPTCCEGYTRWSTSNPVNVSKIPRTTVYITPAPPGPIFQARYLHRSWNSAGAKKARVGIISPRAFRRRTVRDWHSLGCREIELGKPPQGGLVLHTPSHTAPGMQVVCFQLGNMSYNNEI